MINIGLFFIFAFLGAAVLLGVMRAKSGKLPEIRQIAAMDAIEESVGRAVEMDKDVHFFLAASGGLFEGRGAAGAFGSFPVLSYVARLTANKGARFVFSSNSPEVTNVAYDIIQTAYVGEGKANLFRPDEMVRYYATVGYREAISGYLLREKPAANIMMGDISNEAVVLADMSYIAGAMSIAGCQRETQLPFIVALCDYTMVGEELLVAGAYLSKNPMVLGSVQGQDMTKFFIMVLSVMGAALSTFGITQLQQFIKG